VFANYTSINSSSSIYHFLWLILWHCQYLYYTVLNGRTIHKLWIGKYSEGSDHGIIEVISLYVRRKTEENHDKPELLALTGQYCLQLCSPNTGRGDWTFLTVTSYSLYCLRHVVTINDAQFWPLSITLKMSHFLPQMFYAKYMQFYSTRSTEWCNSNEWESDLCFLSAECWGTPVCPPKAPACCPPGLMMVLSLRYPD
jgi:hypothetical protein